MEKTYSQIYVACLFCKKSLPKDIISSGVHSKYCRGPQTETYHLQMEDSDSDDPDVQTERPELNLIAEENETTIK